WARSRSTRHKRAISMSPHWSAIRPWPRAFWTGVRSTTSNREFVLPSIGGSRGPFTAKAQPHEPGLWTTATAGAGAVVELSHAGCPSARPVGRANVQRGFGRGGRPRDRTHAVGASPRPDALPFSF